MTLVIPDDAVLREYERQSQADPLATNATLYGRTAKALGVTEDRVEWVVLERAFGWGAG